VTASGDVAVPERDLGLRVSAEYPHVEFDQVGGGVPPAGVFAVEQRREPAVVDQHAGQMQVQMGERGLYLPVDLRSCLFQHQAGGGDLSGGQQPRCGVAGGELGGQDLGGPAGEARCRHGEAAYPQV
jgi:hypothetical protein